MMLKPFRVRSLYDSSPGVIQITGVQYDSTIKSQPDAALSYLDDDDGETILVGSSLELQQRLDEPVPGQSTMNGSHSTQLDEVSNSLHTFDIQHSSASLATWREHEAYSSKMLRKPSSSTLPETAEHPASFASVAKDSTPPHPVPAVLQDSPVSAQEAITGALQGLETHVGAFAEFLQDTSNALRAVAEATREADASAVQGILDGFKGIFGEVAKVGRAMIEAFDPESFAATQIATPVTVQRSTTCTAEKETKREASDVPAPHHDALFPHEPLSLAPVPQVAPPQVPLHTTDPIVGIRTSFSRPTDLNELSSSTRAQPSSSEAPFAAYAHLRDPWNLNSGRRPGSFSANEVACDYCRRRKMKCSGKLAFSDEVCSRCDRDKQICSLVKYSEPEGTATVSNVPPPNLCDQKHEVSGSKLNNVTGNKLYPPPPTVQRDENVQFPKETAKSSFAQAPKQSTLRSILDLENSDPDFSKRYPPLMTLRKSKTITSLVDRSRSPFLTNINPEAEISRFPSLSQIEHKMRTDRNHDNLVRNTPSLSNRWSFDEDRPNQPQTALRPTVVPTPISTDRNTTPAVAQKLPGAWPESRPEVEGAALPTTEESSGAFFNRMTRSRSPEPANKTSQYIPVHLRDPSELKPNAPLPPRPRRHPLTVDTSNVPPRYLRQPRSNENFGQLGRSNTITASNPAARLTTPFDPLEDLRQSREATAMPRRRETERHRRRDYHDSYTGAGRMPWESFENVSRFDRSVAARIEPRQSRRNVQANSGNDRTPGFGIPDEVSKCVQQLRDMGYGSDSPHEASRLSIYAAVCNGNVIQAVEIIEEDRKAGLQRQHVGDKLGVKPFNHNERPTFGGGR